MLILNCKDLFCEHYRLHTMLFLVLIYWILYLNYWFWPNLHKILIGNLKLQLRKFLLLLLFTSQNTLVNPRLWILNNRINRVLLRLWFQNLLWPKSCLNISSWKVLHCCLRLTLLKISRLVISHRRHFYLSLWNFKLWLVRLFHWALL
jgi:hypothetical protein